MDETEDLTTDVLMTLHLGLIHLEGGNLERAVAAGNYLCNTLSTEPDFDNKLFLRLNPDNTPIVEFDSAMKPFMVVEKSLPEQLYFMLGYPIAYLVLLFDNTKDKKYLEAAKVYANFALQCNQSIFSSNFSHKVGWGLSLLYKYNPEDEQLDQSPNKRFPLHELARLHDFTILIIFLSNIGIKLTQSWITR